MSAPASAAPEAAAAPAAVAALNDNGPLSATAQASLLTVDIDALSPALLPQTNIALAPSAAQAASDQDFDADQAGAQRSAAIGGVTYGSNLLGEPLDVQSNAASAPAPESNDSTLIPIDASPLLDLPIINSHAEANWISDTECVAADTPMSLATQTAADVTLIEPAEGQSVLALNTDPGRGAVDTEVSTWLVPIDGPGDARAVQARATTTIATANLLNELAGPGSQITVDVVQAPDYVVTASGLPGGASVTGDRPVVAVTLGSDPAIVLDDSNPTAEATIVGLTMSDLFDGLDPLLTELQPIVRLSIPYEEHIAADGTSASVSGSILRVEILPPSTDGLTQPVADLLTQLLTAIVGDVTAPLLEANLAPITASVVAPAGGIDCAGANTDNPLRELNKHATATEVAPGGTFDYVISVPNRGPCALTGVTVTDTITGPGFEVIATEPDATIEGGTVTFDVGDLAVNETVNLVITVQVADDAPDGSTFDDVVNATGVCDGRTVSQDDDLLDIPTVRDDFVGPCNVQFSNKDASHLQVTPGETFSYYVHVYNSGAEPCTDVVVTDTLDDRVSFVSCNKGCENTGQKVVWTLASVPGGSSVALAVVVKVDDDATGTLANAAIIEPSNGAPKTVTSTGPVVGSESIIKDPTPAARNLRALPRTGGTVPVGTAAGLGAVALALLAIRRRVLPT